MMSNLAQDMVEEILSRVPITCLRTVRSTCKRWNGLSKDPSFRKKHCVNAAKDLLVIMMNGYRVFLMSFNLNSHKYSVPSTKLIGVLNQVEICRVFHYCNGLLLCLTLEGYTTRLVVWNPYLGQTRWIKPRTTDKQSDWFGLGYDNINNKLKIIKLFQEFNKIISYEIYDFNSSSWRWRVHIFAIPVNVLSYKPSVSLKGNTYFLAKEIVRNVQVVQDEELFLLCFDFTSERFGAPLRLPFHNVYTYDDDIVLSGVREEKLAVLFQNQHKLEIWITTKIEPNEVSWNKFLALDTKKTIGFYYLVERKRFFVDEEKKVAVICNLHGFIGNKNDLNETAYIAGENGYLKEVDLGPKESQGYRLCPLVCSSYVPSFASLDSSEGEV